MSETTATQPGPSPREQDHADLRDLRTRIALACARMPIRRIADLTGANAESVRRYLRGDKPSALFVVRLCGRMRLSPSWLLLGLGPMREPPATRGAGVERPGPAPIRVRAPFGGTGRCAQAPGPQSRRRASS